MIVKLLTEHPLGFLCLKRGCTSSSESTLVKMPYCWKSCVAAQLLHCSLSTNQAQFESNYRSYYCNYCSNRTSIVATIVLLDINGGSEHRYSSRLSGSLF